MSQSVKFHKGNSQKLKEVKVPAGWGLLKVSQVVEKGDMFFDKQVGTWQKVDEGSVHHQTSSETFVVIRKYIFGCNMKPFEKDNRKCIILE
jgi:hypothetical protein